jgi:hypothetical protein
MPVWANARGLRVRARWDDRERQRGISRRSALGPWMTSVGGLLPVKRAGYAQGLGFLPCDDVDFRETTEQDE